MTGKNKLGRSRIASAALTVLFAATLGGFAAFCAENVRAVQVATTARWQAETEAARRTAARAEKREKVMFLSLSWKESLDKNIFV